MPRAKVFSKEDLKKAESSIDAMEGLRVLLTEFIEKWDDYEKFMLFIDPKVLHKKPDGQENPLVEAKILRAIAKPLRRYLTHAVSEGRHHLNERRKRGKSRK